MLDSMLDLLSNKLMENIWVWFQSGFAKTKIRVRNDTVMTLENTYSVLRYLPAQWGEGLALIVAKIQRHTWKVPQIPTNMFLSGNQKSTNHGDFFRHQYLSRPPPQDRGSHTNPQYRPFAWSRTFHTGPCDWRSDVCFKNLQTTSIHSVFKVKLALKISLSMMSEWALLSSICFTEITESAYVQEIIYILYKGCLSFKELRREYK